MSTIYNPRFERGGYGKYNKNKYFISMEAGTDAFYLEDEANESQWIQNELRADLIRKEYYSGIYFKYDNDIILSSQVFNDDNKIKNSFLIKPMIANINGYLIDVLGSNGFDILISNDKIDNINIKDLNYIKLFDPPRDGEYYDFVYLEMCFAEIKFNNDIWFLGNRNNSYGIITNDLFDKRVNNETNRRIQLKWNISVARVPLSSENLFDESIYKVYTPATSANYKSSTFGYWNSTKSLDNETISDDIGLWIAGTGLDENGFSSLYTTNGYSYAIPLFKVKRRNTNKYYSDNLLGGDLYSENTNRPDGKFADIIYNDDIIDLRNLIRINNFNKVLHNSFENLLLNKSNYETKLYSTFFGVDAILPDSDTLLYEGCNVNNFSEALLRGDKQYEFVSGIEQEAILLKNNTYLSKDFNVANKELTCQFFIKTDSKDKIGLYEISKSSTIFITSYIENDYLYVKVGNNVISYNFKKHYNKFTHIGIAFRINETKLIINNKIIQTLQHETINVTNSFTVTFGFANNAYAKCIFDEIEISNVYEDQFSRIPKAISNDNADFSIDTQLARKNYTLINNVDTYTFHQKYTASSSGTINFTLTLPLKLTFTDDTPVIYFDNESDSINTNIIWHKEDNMWLCTITGLGANIPYNLVIIAIVNFPDEQGLAMLPKHAYAVLAEKAPSNTFYAVSDLVDYQLHNIKYPALFDYKNQLFVLNPYIYQTGFCTGIKYYLRANGKNLEINNINNNIVGIYSIIYNEKNILKNYYINNNKYVITLTEFINDEIEINFITNEYCSLYSPMKAGILNLYRVEEISNKGNGTKTEYIYRSDSKIISFLKSKFDNQEYNYVFVNGIPTRVNVVINGTFVHYIFENPPANKADIIAYVVSEYDLLRSERLEFIYEIDINNKENIEQYHNCDIIYHENEIFVTTDGYGVYPYKKDLRDSKEIRLKDTSTPYPDFVAIVDNVSGNAVDDNDVHSSASNEEYDSYILNKLIPRLDYLPTTDLLRFSLSPKDLLSNNKCKIVFDNNNEAHINEAHILIKEDYLPISTNLSAYINYCIPSAYGSLFITFNKLNTKYAQETIKGYKNCSIDNNSFYSLTELDQEVSHINVLPFIIQDKKTKLLKLGIITHLRNDNIICIDNNNSAIDIYPLNANYLIKHI